MKIGIELRYIVAGHAGGIVPHLKGVLDALFANNPDHDFYVFCSIYNRNLLQHGGVNTHFFSLPTDTYWMKLDQLCLEKGIDVLFRSYPVEDSVQFPMSRQIYMIPDIQHEYFPDFFTSDVIRSRRLAFNKALIEAGAICTTSDYTRHTLDEYKWTRCKDIFLAGPALSVDYEKDTAGSLTEVERALLPTKDFFLFPANLWPHKNHRRVLEAFSAFLASSGRDMEFVFTGHPDGWPALQADFPELPVKHLGFVSPQLLGALFQNTVALVFFSLYEGFGIPLLEAFQHGAPVICSNTTSLPEVGGEAVLSCDPTDVKAMSHLMEEIVGCDSQFRETLIKKGKERLACYTWDKAASNLLQGCERVAEDRNFDKSSGRMRLTVQEPPVVSIVTPSFNQGRFLKRTIDSVLNQDYPHIEYMVMDGGSSDESVEILQSYGNRFHWVSEPDGGQTAAINKGFARFPGQIQAYLNSDDVLLPGTVAKVVKYFEKNPRTDMVYGLADYIDENDNFIGPYNTADYSFVRLMDDCCVCQPAAFWQQRIVEKIGPFNEDLDLVMDYDYWLRIDRAGGIISHLRDKLAYSRLYDDTKTMSARAAIYREIFDICQQHGGYISGSFILGYWHHRIFEASSGWPRHFKKVPKFTGLLTVLHHKKHQINRLRNRQYLYQLLWARWGAAISRYLLRWQWSQSFLRHQAFAMDRRHAALGVFSDNWLNPTCSYVPRNISPGQEFYFVGVAPVDTEVTIKQSGKMIGRVAMKAKREQKVSFTLSPGNNEPVLFLFDNYVYKKEHERKCACKLIETNLFLEQDVLV